MRRSDWRALGAVNHVRHPVSRSTRFHEHHTALASKEASSICRPTSSISASKHTSSRSTHAFGSTSLPYSIYRKVIVEGTRQSGLFQRLLWKYTVPCQNCCKVVTSPYTNFILVPSTGSQRSSLVFAPFQGKLLTISNLLRNYVCRINKCCVSRQTYAGWPLL